MTRETMLPARVSPTVAQGLEAHSSSVPDGRRRVEVGGGRATLVDLVNVRMPSATLFDYLLGGWAEDVIVVLRTANAKGWRTELGGVQPGRCADGVRVLAKVRGVHCGVRRRAWRSAGGVDCGATGERSPI